MRGSECVGGMEAEGSGTFKAVNGARACAGKQWVWILSLWEDEGQTYQECGKESRNTAGCSEG